MYADGCVYASENRVEITLKGSDIQHLHKFAKFLKTTKNNFVKYYNATLKNRILDVELYLEVQKCIMI